MSAKRGELSPDLNQILLAALLQDRASVWTAMPAIIKSYNADRQTAEVLPTVQALLSDEKGEKTWTTMPMLVDCPVVFPSGGGHTLTFPIKVGDECLVIFASRCIDSWWQSGGVQVQADFRMHDLSDGFVLPGPRSLPRKLSPAPAMDRVELRNDSGTAKIAITDSGAVQIDAPGTLTINAATLVINGNVETTGTLKNNTKLVGSTHTHGGVSVGGGFTGAPS